MAMAPAEVCPVCPCHATKSHGKQMPGERKPLCLARTPSWTLTWSRRTTWTSRLEKTSVIFGETGDSVVEKARDAWPGGHLVKSLQRYSIVSDSSLCPPSISYSMKRAPAAPAEIDGVLRAFGAALHDASTHPAGQPLVAFAAYTRPPWARQHSTNLNVCSPAVRL